MANKFLDLIKLLTHISNSTKTRKFKNKFKGMKENFITMQPLNCATIFKPPGAKLLPSNLKNQTKTKLN